MDAQTKAIGEYIKNKGINLAKMSRDTGIPYVSLYDSLLNGARDRNLRAGEYMRICNFLDVNPMDFVKEMEK